MVTQLKCFRKETTMVSVKKFLKAMFNISVFNTTATLSRQTSIFGVLFFVSKSLGN